MVVANPGLAQRRVLGAGPGAHVAALRRQSHHALQHAAHVVAGQGEVAVPALLLLAQQAAGLELAQVGAGGLQGHVRLGGQLARRQRLAAHERGQHVGPGRITDQRGNAQVVNSMVPLANMFGYVDNLRSMSQGRANYTMQFDHYAEVPRNVADEVVAKYA